MAFLTVEWASAFINTLRESVAEIQSISNSSVEAEPATWWKSMSRISSEKHSTCAFSWLLKAYAWNRFMELISYHRFHRPPIDVNQLDLLILYFDTFIKNCVLDKL